MHREPRNGSGLVFETFGHLSENLRRDLETAKIHRPELHRPLGVGALPLRFHDLRATGITYMAIRGDSDNDIRERAGHADFKTTQMYIRRGHLAGGAALGEPFAPLPDALLGRIVPGNVLEFPPMKKTGTFDAGSAEREKGFETGSPPVLQRGAIALPRPLHGTHEVAQAA